VWECVCARTQLTDIAGDWMEHGGLYPDSSNATSLLAKPGVYVCVCVFVSMRVCVFVHI